MALTFRDIKLAALSYDEMDSNWRFFTGSFTNTGTITATNFTATSDISASGEVFGDIINAYNIIKLGGDSVRMAYNSPTDNLRVYGGGLEVGNTNKLIFTETGNITASGNISSSADVYGVTGSFLHLLGDGSQLTGIGGGGIFAQTGSFQATTNDLQITGSVKVNGIIRATSNIQGDGIASTTDLEMGGGGSFNFTERDNDFKILSPQTTETHFGEASYGSKFMGPTTASLGLSVEGDMSSSANIYGVTGSFSHLLGSSPLTIESDNLNVDSSGNITSSGTIWQLQNPSGIALKTQAGYGQVELVNTNFFKQTSISTTGILLITIPITPGKITTIDAYVQNQTGLVNTGAYFHIVGTFGNNAGTVNQIGSTITPVSQASSNTGAVNFTTTGTGDVKVEVDTGTQTLFWNAYYTKTSMTNNAI